MDLHEDRPNVADTERYAFLLGSALRSDDLEQFFCIYDSIIPEHLSEVQVDRIKERAREIAELAEGDFNRLVVKARDFSLAYSHPLPPPPPSPTPTAAMRTSGQMVSNHVAEKKEDPPSSSPPLVPKLPLHSSAFSPPPLRKDGLRDDDSGLLSSSIKTDPGRTSTSSDEALDMEERGAHDYFPHPSPAEPEREEAIRRSADETKVKCCVSKSLSVGDMYDARHYDEAVMVENDSDSIESPRSDVSSGSQSQTLERVGRPKTTALVDAEPPKNIHKELYASTLFSNRKNTTRTRAASTSPARTSSRFFAKGVSSSPGASCRIGGKDDSPYSVAGLSGPSRHSPDMLRALSGVPLSPQRLSCFMQESYNLSDKSVASSGATATSEGKRKKKKKKETCDDSGQEKRSLIKPVDENGNPLPRVSHEQYLRLRQPPNTPQRSSKEAGFSTNPNSDSATPKTAGESPGNKPEDPKTSKSTDKRKRKRNGGSKPDEVAQNCPNYVGDVSDVDMLVMYVNNGVSKKQLKNGGPPNKSKSTKQLITTGVGENSEDGLPPPSETTQLLRSSLSSNTYCSVRHCPPLSAGENSVTEDQETERCEAAESGEMGNSPACEQSATTEMVTVSEATVKVHAMDADWTQSAGDNRKAASPPATVSNHVITATKCSSKKAPNGEGKDRGKTKNGSTNNHKKDGAQSDNSNNNNTDISQVNNNKSKEKSDKSPQTGYKAENMLEKEPSADVEKAKKVNRGVINFSSSDNSGKGVETDLAVGQDGNAGGFTVVVNPRKKKPKNQAVSQTVNSTAHTSSHLHSHNKDTAHSSSHLYSHNKDSADLSLPASQFSSSSDTFSYYSRRFEPGYKRRVSPQLQYRSSPPPPPPPPPPPHLASPSEVEREETTVQDLSQSAFPALNPTDRSCGLFQFLGQEARSLEDLACGVSLDRDSDQASSKSLPAVQGRGNRVCYPVSYASMASANTPRQSVDSSQAASVGSSVYDSEESAVVAAPTAAMKWKGSPQERRHSIGSAPEDLSKVAGSTGLQRTGSQEMLLPRDGTDKASKGLASPVNVSADSSGRDSPASRVAGQEKAVPSVVCPEGVADMIQPLPASVQACSQAALLSGGAASSVSATSVSSPCGTGSVPCLVSSPSANSLTSIPTRGPHPSRSSRSHHSSPGTIPPTAAVQSKVNLAKLVHNDIHKKKCVIFCNDLPEENRDCDYSFGDLPESWIDGEFFVMPSAESESIAASVSVSGSVEDSRSVSPGGGLATPPPAAANGVSHALSSHTVCSDAPVSASPQMPSGSHAAPACSSHSQTHLPFKACPAATEQLTAGDFKPSSRESRVHPTTSTANIGVAVTSSSLLRCEEDRSVHCDSDVRSSSKPTKASHVAGLNGVIPVQVVSQGLDAHRSTSTHTLVVPSSHTLIPTRRSHTACAQAEGVTDTRTGSEKNDDACVTLKSSSAVRPEKGTESFSTGDDGSEDCCRWRDFSKSGWVVSQQVQEPRDSFRQQMNDNYCTYLSQVWQTSIDAALKEPSKVDFVGRPVSRR